MAEQFEHPLDELDVRLLRELTATPRAPILELSRRLGIARNTVYARIDRLQSLGVIRNFGPVVELEAIGYGVTAFTTVELLQGRFAEVIEQLKEIPQVIEVHTIAGQGDLLVRIAAHLREGVAQLAAADLDTMLAFGREPAPIETGGRDDELAAFLGRPVEILVDTLLRDPADDGGGDQYDDCQHDQQCNDAFLHGEFLQ